MDEWLGQPRAPGEIGATELVISQHLMAALKGQSTSILKTGIFAGNAARDGSMLGAAAIDQLLSRHSADTLLEKLNSLELQAQQWRVVIARLRAAISSHAPSGYGADRGSIGSAGVRGAPPCEADDEFWYL